MSGRSVARRTADTAARPLSGSSAECRPPRDALPHDRLSSMPATPGTPSRRRAAYARSDADSPAQVDDDRHRPLRPGRSRSARGPLESRGSGAPSPAGRPAGTSAVRGAGCPERGLSVVPRVTIPPSRGRSTISATSTPYPNGPAATITGLTSTRPRPRSTSRATGRPPMASRAADGAGEAAGAEGRRSRRARRRCRGRAAVIAGLIRRTVGVRDAFAVSARRFAFTRRAPSRARRPRTRAPRGTPAGTARPRHDAAEAGPRGAAERRARRPPGATPCVAPRATRAPPAGPLPACGPASRRPAAAPADGERRQRAQHAGEPAANAWSAHAS